MLFPIARHCATAIELLTAVPVAVAEEIPKASARQRATLNDLRYLYKSYDDIKTSDKQMKIGKLEVRLLPYAPSFGILSFNSNLRNGFMYVELDTHGAGYDLKPTFNLSFQKDGKWYIYFMNQFEEMWKYAKPWKPEPI